MAIVDSNQTVERTAASTLKAAIIGSDDFASWVGWEYLQQNPTQIQEALKIVAAIEAGQFTLDDLCSAAQSKTGAVGANLIGNPDPELTVLGHTFDIGHLLGATQVDVWTSGQAKNLQYHSREYFTGIGTEPKGYVDGWENPNKAPVATADTDTALENTIITGTVADHVTDANGDVLKFKLAAPVAGLTFNDDGSYKFDANHADYQHLAAGAHEDVIVNYSVDDGHGGTTTSTLTITITGADDEASMDGKYDGSVTEDGAQTAAGTINVTDVDDNQAHSKVVGASAHNSDGGLGSYSVDADGNWSYTVDNDAIQHLGAKDSITDTFVVDSADGTAHETVTVTINGVNDAPKLTDAKAALVDGTEDTPYTIKAADLLTGFSDVDDGDTLSVSGLHADHGSLALNADGKSWTFTPDANYNGKVALTYDVVDGHVGGVIAGSQSFSLAAVNDAPTATSWSVTGVETDTKTVARGVADILKIDLLSHASDVDGDSLSVSNIKVDGNGLPSYVKLDDDGHTLLVDLNSAGLDYLLKGAHELDNITFTVSDQAGASVNSSVSLDITGTADKYFGGSVSQVYEKTAVNSQTFQFDLHTQEGAFDFTNGKVTVSVQGDIDSNNEKATVVDVSSVDFTGFVFDGGGSPGQVDGTDPDNVFRSGSATVSNAALSDGHVDFNVTLSQQIDGHNGTTLTGTLTYDYWA